MRDAHTTAAHDFSLAAENALKCLEHFFQEEERGAFACLLDKEGSLIRLWRVKPFSNTDDKPSTDAQKQARHRDRVREGIAETAVVAIARCLAGSPLTQKMSSDRGGDHGASRIGEYIFAVRGFGTGDELSDAFMLCVRQIYLTQHRKCDDTPSDKLARAAGCFDLFQEFLGLCDKAAFV